MSKFKNPPKIEFLKLFFILGDLVYLQRLTHKKHPNSITDVLRRRSTSRGFVVEKLLKKVAKENVENKLPSHYKEAWDALKMDELSFDLGAEYGV